MGKRKKSSRGPQGPKKREGLATAFKCVFCNHESSVTIKIDKKVGVGNLNCKQCGANFQSGVHVLSLPVDVYSEWIDACEDVAGQGASSNVNPPAFARPSQPTARPLPGPTQTERYTDDDDGFVVNDEPDAEADYADEDD